MKLDSKYFDMIRIRPQQSQPEQRSHRNAPPCQWKGCSDAGNFRAPVGRGRDGEFYSFCSDHVRAYNASYNYFEGMSDAQVQEFQKDALTGHRPTWKVGANAWSHGTHRGMSGPEVRQFAEAQQARKQSFHAWRASQAQQKPEAKGRALKPLERKSLDALGLVQGASREEIKARFKDLVKRHHPDSNGGDRGSEEKLREIIQAYNYLKQAGLV